MDISIVKLTPSKRQKNLMFVDVTLNDLGILLKGVKIISTKKEKIVVLLPCLLSEKPRKRHYSPMTFLSKDMHHEFKKDVEFLVSKLLNIGDPKR